MVSVSSGLQIDVVTLRFSFTQTLPYVPLPTTPPTHHNCRSIAMNNKRRLHSFWPRLSILFYSIATHLLKSSSSQPRQHHHWPSTSSPPLPASELKTTPAAQYHWFGWSASSSCSSLTIISSSWKELIGHLFTRPRHRSLPTTAVSILKPLVEGSE